MSDRRRYGFITLVVLLMAAGVWVVGELVREATHDQARAAAPVAATTAPLSRQEGQFLSLRSPTRVASPNEAGARQLATIYDRRAYAGAPPFIPHPVEMEMPGADGCASCHQYGGWSPGFQAHAPRTPHPELLACRQCHVAQVDDSLFRGTTWQPSTPPVMAAALPGSPPPLPHPLQMRESCLACHDGPAAPTELRTTHPERVGCLQCHVPQAATPGWVRPAMDEGSP